MKKLLSIIALIALSFSALAQTPGPIYATPYMRSFLYSANQAAAQAYLGVGGSGDFVLRASGNATNLTVHTNLTLSSGNIILGANWVSGDGGNEGLNINSTGQSAFNAAPQSGSTLAVGGTDPTPLTMLRATTGASGVQFGFQKLNAASTIITYSQMGSLTTDDTVGTEDSDIYYNMREAGTLSEKFRFKGTGRFGVGVTSPTAGVHIKAGAAAAGSAPIKLTSGTNLTTPEAGAVEFDGTQLYFTPGSVRYNVGLTRAPFTAYSAGTAYALTATPALLDFGTTDPTVTLTAPGTYAVRARVRVDYTGATFAAPQEVTLKIRRTNNTAADLTNGSAGFLTSVTTTETSTAQWVTVEVIYTTANSDDILQVWGSVAATPGAGSLDAQAASIMAVKLY